MNELEHFRHHKDEYLRSDPHSPLSPQQRREFKGLRYFPENSALRFEVPLDDVPHEDLVLPTSTGAEQTLRRAGKFHLQVGGREFDITAFGDPAQGELFIPFRDGTSGRESYGAGRYLEAYALGDGLWLIDFNLAYNPYCAYNDRWSCPLPPAQNWLRVPIEAGEQVFHE